MSYLTLCCNGLFHKEERGVRLVNDYDDFNNIVALYGQIMNGWSDKKEDEERKVIVKKGFVFYLEFYYRLTAYKIIELDKLNNSSSN